MLAAAFAVYRRVAVPVGQLGGRVRRDSSELTLPTPVAVSGPAEVAALGDDVNVLIASVSRELGERMLAEKGTRASGAATYRLLFERSPLPMWNYDLRDAPRSSQVNAVASLTTGTRATSSSPSSNERGSRRRTRRARPLRDLRRRGISGHDGSELEVRTHQLTG